MKPRYGDICLKTNFYKLNKHINYKLTVIRKLVLRIDR